MFFPKQFKKLAKLFQKCKENMYNNRFNKTLYLCLVTILFLAWSGLFIFRTSFQGIDGKRYFCLFDDAMISMRYAYNLSNGLGLVWNASESLRIEGFTNMLMTLYMSLGTTLFDKVTAVLFIQLSGIGFMLAVAYFSMKIAEEIFTKNNSINRDFLMILVFTATLCYYPLVYWSLMGMETGLLSGLLLSATWLAIRFGNKLKVIVSLPILMGLSFLTRPDALIFVFLIMTYRSLGIIKQKKGLAILLIEIAIISTFVISLTIFRWNYYDNIVPNTAFLKLSGMPMMHRIKNGIGFTLPFLKSMSALIFIALFNIGFNFRKNTFLLMLLFLASVIYQIWIGGDPWAYWRIMSPVTPLLFILCIDEVSNVLSVQFKSNIINDYISRPLLERFFFVVGVTFFLLVMANSKFAPEISFLHDPYQLRANLCEPYQVRANRINVNTAIAISQIANSNASVAVFWAGTISYYTGLRSIDMLGKSDKYIASLSPDTSGAISWNGMRSVPGHNKYDLRYSIMILRPTYVQGFSWGLDDISTWAKQNYEKVQYKGVDLWLLKDSKDVFWEKIYMDK